MRVERAITLGIVYPFRKVISFPAKTGIPILMYHSISDDPESTVHPYFRVNTSAAMFDRHLAFLHNNGFESLRLSRLSEALKNTKSNPHKKYAVITFDDGLLDFYTGAFPLLAKYGYTASVFLPTGYIKDYPVLNHENRFSLSWPQIREMSDAGISFGSHTITHPNLSLLDCKTAEHEIVDSKKHIEDSLGKPVDSFAHPFRFPEEDKGYVSFYRSILNNAGYRYGLTTVLGTVSAGSDLLTLKRLPVNSCDDSLLLNAKLEGAYNWLPLPQRIVKNIRRLALLGQTKS